MSSIYRKGRDGYFYYQTYVYNRKTKKKDKRIFHSLGTKDRDTANRKKIEYDNAYANAKGNSLFPRRLNFKKRYFNLAFILGLTCIFFYLQKQSVNKSLNKSKMLKKVFSLKEKFNDP